MTEVKKLICINCPIGCQLEATRAEDGSWLIKGNLCPRGEVYGKKELTQPERVLTTTVRITGAKLKRLPVRTEKPIPKALIKEAMTAINATAAKAPVSMGDVILCDLLGTGVNVIASRNMLP